MEKLLELLYHQFILRDLLSIFSAGSICFFGVKRFINSNVSLTDLFPIADEYKFIALIVVVTLIYVLGLMINFIRDFFYFLLFSKPVDGITISKHHFIKFHSEKVKQYYDSKIKINGDKNDYEYFKSRNERLVVIFQVLGNVGISLTIFGSSFFKDNCCTAILFIIFGAFQILFSIRVFYYHRYLNESYQK